MLCPSSTYSHYPQTPNTILKEMALLASISFLTLFNVPRKDKKNKTFSPKKIEIIFLLSLDLLTFFGQMIFDRFWLEMNEMLVL